MLTTGKFVDAHRARDLGLINRVVKPEELPDQARALAETVAEKLSVAVKIGKQAFYAQMQMPIDQAYAFTGEVMVENMLHRDTEEGIQAFIEKRKPDWHK